MTGVEAPTRFWRCALIRRLPTLRPPAVSRPIVGVEDRGRYPALAADFATLDEILVPAFVECDLAALRHQNRYRRQNVTVLLGAAVATGLGGLQAVWPDERWPTIVLGALGLVLASSARIAGESTALRDYLSNRMRAERLRALYFAYLAMAGRYAGADREVELRRATRAIERGEDIA